MGKSILFCNFQVSQDLSSYRFRRVNGFSAEVPPPICISNVLNLKAQRDSAAHTASVSVRPHDNGSFPIKNIEKSAGVGWAGGSDQNARQS